MGPTTRRQRKLAEEKEVADASILSDTPEASHSGAAKHGQEPAATTTASGGKLVVFGDDDNDKAITALPVKHNGPASGEAKAKSQEAREEVADEEDSDDEAPEAVSTSKAASDIKKAAAASREAAREQAAAQKRKRQQRDELFKQQAERKKAEEGEKKAAAARQRDADGKAQSPKETGQVAVPGKQRVDKLVIPALLPAELLTDSSDESEGEEGQQTTQEGTSRHKKRKVAAVENRLSRLDRATGRDHDERVGGTVYRVVKGRDERLAPKSRKQAKNSKDALLRRNRVAVKGNGGFLKKK